MLDRRPCGSGGLAAIGTLHNDGRGTDRGEAAAPTGPLPQGRSHRTAPTGPLLQRECLQRIEVNRAGARRNTPTPDHSTQARAFLNMRIHGLSSPQCSGCQLI